MKIKVERIMKIKKLLFFLSAVVLYWYRIRKGEFGRIEQGNQILYVHRSLWSGIGGAPQGGDIVAFSTLRFYLP